MENEISYEVVDNIPTPPKPPTPPKDLKTTVVKPKSNRLKFYLFPSLTIVFSILIFIFLWFIKASMIILIFYGIIIFPLFFFSGLIFFARVYLDRHKVKGIVIKRVSKNFIIANFYRENRRIKKIPLLINKHGQTFNYNKGLYTINKQAIWLDDNNHPNSYYVENLPNPIIFEFQEDINKFLKQIISKDNQQALNNKGMLIDLSFSSETLQMFKKDKIFAEFMKNPEHMKLLYILMGLVGLAFVTIILVVIFIQ